MSARLLNRQQHIPGGFVFALPELGWRNTPYQSFDSIVGAVHGVIQSNLKLAQEKGWPTDRESIANWIDSYNASVCEQAGWRNFYTGSGDVSPPPPKSTPLSSSVTNVAAGAKTLADWIGSGAHPVTKEQAEARAGVCVKCPMNKEGDLSNFFTRAAAEIIRMQVQTAQDLELTTKHDKQLGVCQACACPIRLKVWVALKPILEHMPAESKAALDSKCWILSEELAINANLP